MGDISLKGVARRYLGITGGFSVVQDIFGARLPLPPIVNIPVSAFANESLRTALELLAWKEHSFSQSECTYDWTAAFEQTWTHIRMRIRLNPDSDVSTATLNTLRTTWQNGIQNVWNNKWGCGRSGELSCRLTFEVVWVDNNEHHEIRVNTGQKCTDISGNPVRCRTHRTRWHTNDPGSTAAHEYGHSLGLVDEYTDTDCPGRSPVNTGTVMDNNSNNVPARMMTRFANNIDSNVVAPP